MMSKGVKIQERKIGSMERWGAVIARVVCVLPSMAKKYVIEWCFH